MNGKLFILFLLSAIAITHSSFAQQGTLKKQKVYIVKRLKKPFKLDGNWNKRIWRRANTIEITNYTGKIPAFLPKAKVKMLYDNENVYVIFQVHDRYVRSVVEEYNGRVSSDACVEWFFSPDVVLPDHYFNLETNAGGTPLMAFHIFGKKEYEKFSKEELDRIEIAHSLPKKVDPEITGEITWTIEYKLPVDLLQKHSSVTLPRHGITWNANFYKTASKGSNIHYITWTPVISEVPNFHLPEFFGQIKFQ
jgi:hypothetical protein